MTAFTVGFGALVIVGISEPLRRNKNRIIDQGRVIQHLATLIVVCTALVLAMLVVASVWGILLLGLGVFSDLETSTYFSMISFTTVGYGDVVAPIEWRLLSAFISVDGFLLFGLNTAFIFEILRRMRDDKAD